MLHRNKKNSPELAQLLPRSLEIHFLKRGFMNQSTLAVEEFTTPSPVTATEDESIEQLDDLMQLFEIRHIPIVRDGRVVGIVSDRDLKVASGLSSREKIEIQASDIMVSNPVTVSAGAPLEEVAFEMSQKKIGCVIVNDENDNFFGIFTVVDALNALVEITRDESLKN